MDTGNDRVLVFDNNFKDIEKLEGLARPEGIALDNEGNIYISETDKVTVYNIKSSGLYAQI